MIFYDCKTAPSPRRVRIFLAEKSISVDTIFVDLRNQEQLEPAFQLINPECTVPVLELDDGTRLNTTAGIWTYLESLYPDPCLMGQTSIERAIIANTQWHIEINGFLAMADYLRNSSPSMVNRALPGPHNYQQIPALADRSELRVNSFLDTINELIGIKPFVAGQNFSIADIDLFVLIQFAAWKHFGLPANATNAHRWYETMTQRPSMAL